MARKFDYEERKVLMKKVEEYALETKYPYSVIAEHFNISVATVHEYIQASHLIDPDTGKLLREYYKSKTDRYKNIANIERIYVALNEVLKGTSQEEIAKMYGVSASAISRDINERLAKYSEQASNLGSKVLKLNKNNKITQEERNVLKNMMLSPLELKIMTSASAYMSGIKLKEVAKYYKVKEEVLISSFVEVLDSLDWILYTQVKEKLISECLTQLPTEEEVLFEEEPIENFRRR